MAFFISMPADFPFINIHTHRPPEGHEICIFNNGTDVKKNASGFSSIGIHPLYITKYNIAETLDLISTNASAAHVKAIGECGLDNRIGVPPDEQAGIFISQIKIAVKVNKPVIVHCVKAFNQFIRIIKKEKAPVPFILHGFNNKEQIAEQLLAAGSYLSFGKALLIENSNAQKAILKTGTDRFFLETDDANVSIKSIFEKAAELKKISVDELKERMMLNFKLLFNHE